MTHVRLHYADLLPGDLMFYDGDGDGTVDHVDVYVGNGWSLDSSSSVGGVTLMWVEDRLVPAPLRPRASRPAGAESLAGPGHLIRRRSLACRIAALRIGQRSAPPGLRVPRDDHGLRFGREPPVRRVHQLPRSARSRSRTP